MGIKQRKPKHILTAKKGDRIDLGWYTVNSFGGYAEALGYASRHGLYEDHDWHILKPEIKVAGEPKIRDIR